MSKKTYKRIKNFSTIIAPEKTIMEIEKMLSEYGATKMMKQYDDKNRPNFLAFMINTEHGEIPIKLPLKVHQVLTMFDEQIAQKLLPNSYSGNIEQAYKVGWRIIKDWIDAQLTLLKLRLAKPEEIFLPYLYDYNKQETLFEKIERDGLEAIGYKNTEEG